MTPGPYLNHLQVFQSPGYVALLPEAGDARIIPTDGGPHGTLRQWAGDSRGRWEGNTLVVDTTNGTRVQAQQIQCNLAPGGTFHACQQRRHALIRSHGGGSDDVDESLDL